jgi:hypothetical protein
VRLRPGELRPPGRFSYQPKTNQTKGKNPMSAQIVLLVPLGELGLGAGQLPSFGGIGGGHPSTGPVYPPGHPSAGLPISPGHPEHGLPISPGHPGHRPPNVPPNVVWPPQNPARPDQGLPGWGGGAGGRPSHPISPPTTGTKPIEPGTALPAGSTLILAYNAESGWQGAVVDQSGQTKPIAPPEAQPK